MSNNYKRDYLWNTSGVLLQNLISPLLLIVIAYVNGIADVGVFSFAFATSVVFWMIGMWGGRTYQVSDINKEHTTNSYIWARLLLSIAIIVGSLIFCVINGYDTAKTLLILALVLFKSIESISDVFYGVMQRHDKLYVAGRSLAVKAVLGTVSFILVDLLTEDILLATLCIVVVNGIVFISYDLRKTLPLEPIKIGFHNAKEYSKQAAAVLKVTFPVFIVSFLSIFSLNVPRFFIDRLHESENAYFGIMAMPITLILLVMTFILQPNIVALTRDYKDNKLDTFSKTLRNVALITTVIGLLILIATYLIGDKVLALVFGIDFSGYRLELIVIVLGAVLNAFVAIGVNILTVMRRFKGLFYTLLFSSIVLVPISYILVARESIMGGVISFAVVCGLQACVLYVVYRYSLRNKAQHA